MKDDWKSIKLILLLHLFLAPCYLQYALFQKPMNCLVTAFTCNVIQRSGDISSGRWCDETVSIFSVKQNFGILGESFYIMYYTFGTFRFSETSQDEVTEQFGSEVLKEITPARLFSL